MRLCSSHVYRFPRTLITHSRKPRRGRSNRCFRRLAGKGDLFLSRPSSSMQQQSETCGKLPETIAETLAMCCKIIWYYFWISINKWRIKIREWADLRCYHLEVWGVIIIEISALPERKRWDSSRDLDSGRSRRGALQGAGSTCANAKTWRTPTRQLEHLKPRLSRKFANLVVVRNIELYEILLRTLRRTWLPCGLQDQHVALCSLEQQGHVVVPCATW